MGVLILASVLMIGQPPWVFVDQPKQTTDCKCESCPCKTAAIPPKLNPVWTDDRGNRYETRSDGRHYLIVQRNVGTSAQVPTTSNCAGGVCPVPQQKRR
jgi:hypothetical protein